MHPMMLITPMDTVPNICIEMRIQGGYDNLHNSQDQSQELVKMCLHFHGSQISCALCTVQKT